jgi:hypothetical protein
LDKASFWVRLEYRICAQLRGSEDNRLRYYSCDGLIPEEYDLLGEQRCIQGRAWIGHGRLQEEWKFTLLLAPAVMEQEEIDWAALLPQDTLTSWLTPDPGRKTLMIDLLSGHHAHDVSAEAACAGLHKPSPRKRSCHAAGRRGWSGAGCE